MTPLRSYLWPGVPLALGSATLFGASAPLSKIRHEPMLHKHPDYPDLRHRHGHR